MKICLTYGVMMVTAGLLAGCAGAPSPQGIAGRLFGPCGPPLDYESPVWSPGGSRIAYIAQQAGNEEIYAMDSDGAHKTRLTISPASQQCLHWPF